MERNTFKVLSRAKIKNQRMVVISKFLSKGGYTIGQQVDVQEGSKVLPVFIKGAMHVESLDGLYNLRDALNEAIHLEEDTLDKQKG